MKESWEVRTCSSSCLETPDRPTDLATIHHHTTYAASPSGGHIRLARLLAAAAKSTPRPTTLSSSNNLQINRLRGPDGLVGQIGKIAPGNRRSQERRRRYHAHPFLSRDPIGGVVENNCPFGQGYGGWFPRSGALQNPTNYVFLDLEGEQKEWPNAADVQKGHDLHGP